jgi:hypothetical protein
MRPVAELESLIGGPIPLDYRQFMAKCPGGYIDGKLTHGRHDIVVDWVLSLRPDGYLSVFEHLSEIEHLPRGLLPIIADPFGNYVCIDLQGKIYFFDHECPDQPIKMINDSFLQFVGALEKH